MHEQQGLIARIRQIRRAAADADQPARQAPSEPELRALETRINELEQLVQGLQDSVHRQSTRLGKRIEELEARVQPAALAKAISKDARDRGL